MKYIITSILLSCCFTAIASSESDTTRLKIGQTKIILMTDTSGIDSSIKVKSEIERVNKWAGVDLGVNGFLTPSNSLKLPEKSSAFELDYAKSISVGVNIIEKYIPIAKEKFGIVTGLGLQLNSYALDRDLVYVTTDDTIYGITDSSRSIEKTRLKTSFLQVPILLETNLGRSKKKSFHLAAGVLLGYRIGSKVKQIYEEEGREFKAKNKGDLNINPFRAGLTARIGYGDFTLYANYSLTPFFEKDKGPELYPFTVGISLVSF